MKLPLSCAALALITLTGCSDVNPVGTYATTPESLLRALEENLPSSESTLGKLARDRLAAAQEGASEWRVVLRVNGDSRFSITMELPIVPTLRRSGTWTRKGKTLDLHVTHEFGKLLPQPQPLAATIERNTITVQMPNAPRFVLERQSS